MGAGNGGRATYQLDSETVVTSDCDAVLAGHGDDATAIVFEDAL